MLKTYLTPEEKDMLKPMFWDIDIDNLNYRKHTKFTIERILQYGRSEHIKWLLNNFTGDEIIETVKKSGNIDRKTANFWSVYYKISRGEIKCFQKQSVPGIPDCWK